MREFWEEFLGPMVVVVVVIVALATVVIAPIYLFSVSVNITHGTGEKIGQIVRVENGGFLVKTWEGQLIRGGMTAGSGVIGVAPFEFTIEDPALLEKVTAAMRDQREVKIKYEVEGVYSPFRSDAHGAFLVSIETVEHD